MKIANYFMAGIFLFCVILQYNDPDPGPWMVIYGFAALACILYLTGRLPWWLSGAVGLAAMIWIGALLPQILGTPIDWSQVLGTMHMINSTVETTREIGGLLFIAIWMFLLTASVRSRVRNAPA